MKAVMLNVLDLRFPAANLSAYKCTQLSPSLFRADSETVHARENRTDDVINSERTQNISIYVGLVAASVILSLTRTLLFFHILINSSQHLHNTMFAAILRAPIYFFDSNPIGKL